MKTNKHAIDTLVCILQKIIRFISNDHLFKKKSKEQLIEVQQKQTVKLLKLNKKKEMLQSYVSVRPSEMLLNPAEFRAVTRLSIVA